MWKKPAVVGARSQRVLLACASQSHCSQACISTAWGDSSPVAAGLNPVEKFWSCLRRRLAALDLRDLKQRKVALSRAAFKARVQYVCWQADETLHAMADKLGLAYEGASSGSLESARCALAVHRDFACHCGKNRPWWVLAVNESFLRAPASLIAHKRASVRLWAIPPRSLPDLIRWRSSGLASGAD